MPGHLAALGTAPLPARVEAEDLAAENALVLWREEVEYSKL